jgi:hypothetical protein
MGNISSSESLIAQYEKTIDSLVAAIHSLRDGVVSLSDPVSLVELEQLLHKTTTELSDNVVGLKLQQYLDSEASHAAEQELLKAMPHKLKNKGKRLVTIHTSHGTALQIVVNYYYRSSGIHKASKKHGLYPALLLLGICDRCTPLLSDHIAMMAAATSSLSEAHHLLKLLTGAHVDRKTIQSICRRTAQRARAGLQSDAIVWSDHVKGRVITVSMDGGRIRIRKNKRGPKTAKKRTRYKTDWREPKLLIIYVVDEDGRKIRTIPPMIDASMGGSRCHFWLADVLFEKTPSHTCGSFALCGRWCAVDLGSCGTFT